MGTGVLGGWVATVSRHLVHLRYEMRVDPGVHDRLHHRQMLKVIVCLEQCVARKELNQDTTYTPNVAGI